MDSTGPSRRRPRFETLADVLDPPLERVARWSGRRLWLFESFLVLIPWLGPLVTYFLDLAFSRENAHSFNVSQLMFAWIAYSTLVSFTLRVTHGLSKEVVRLRERLEMLSEGGSETTV